MAQTDRTELSRKAPSRKETARRSSAAQESANGHSKPKRKNVSSTSTSKATGLKVKSKRKSSAKKSPSKKATTKKSAPRKASRRKATSGSDRSITASKRASAAPQSVKKAISKLSLKPTDLIEAYKAMLLARIADEKTIILYKQNKCHFQIGAAGHEAIQIAASKVLRAGKDWFYPYYRDMALCAGLGMTAREFMLNAMNKQDDPNSHGRQMPMHYGHVDLNIVNQSSPTGTQFLQAVGCALAIKKKHQDEVVYVSAGEGTCSQGDYHEALNWAAREKLPVIFLIQNNKYAISVPISEQIAGESIYDISAGYENLERYEVDGTNYLASIETFQHAFGRAIKGDGPSVIEAHVPRLQSHSISDNHTKYRTAQDIENEKKRCPILGMEKFLIRNKFAKFAVK